MWTFKERVTWTMGLLGSAIMGMSLYLESYVVLGIGALFFMAGALLIAWKK